MFTSFFTFAFLYSILLFVHFPKPCRSAAGVLLLPVPRGESSPAWVSILGRKGEHLHYSFLLIFILSNISTGAYLDR